MKNKKITAVIYAVSAAVLYAINTPLSKILLQYVPSIFMASFLYLGTGIGVGIMYAFRRKNEKKEDRLSKEDLPCTLAMIALDIGAPIFLMLGIKLGNASNAALLNNFEIVATTVIALLIFKERVSSKLWIAIVFITAASILLSFDGEDGLKFSYGSLFVLLATLCWGLENNFTRRLSSKSACQIVSLNGICSGSGAFIIALLAGEKLPALPYIFFSLLLGFGAFGLSIFTYIKAQRTLGAAKTSAYYAIAPFVGTFLSFVILGDSLTRMYLIALIVMIIGTVFVVADTLKSDTAAD